MLLSARSVRRCQSYGRDSNRVLAKVPISFVSALVILNLMLCHLRGEDELDVVNDVLDRSIQKRSNELCPFHKAASRRGTSAIEVAMESSWRSDRGD